MAGASGDAPDRGASRVHWGEPPPSLAHRLVATVRRWLRASPPLARASLPELPLALRRTEAAPDYLAAERERDNRRAGAVALHAAESAAEAADWWRADVWAHRALWHFEQAELTLQAVRAARRIGELRAAAGDPWSARRYYAEAIDEARDIGAEHEQGLASLGLGRALLDLGEVTTARRLGRAAADLLERSAAPRAEIEAARGLRGTERIVGETGREEAG